MKVVPAAAVAAAAALCGAGGSLADTHSPHAAPITVSCTNGRAYTFVSPADASHVGQAVGANTNMVALAISVTQDGVEVDHFGQPLVRNPTVIACTSDLGGGLAVVFTSVLAGR